MSRDHDHHRRLDHAHAGRTAAAHRGPIAAPFAVLAGIAATTAALGVSELVAGLLGAQSLVAAVGGFVIANQPPGAKDFVVALFGQNDKLALELLIVASPSSSGPASACWPGAGTRSPPAASPRSPGSGSWPPSATRPCRARRRRRRRGRCHGRHLDAVVAHRPGPVGRARPARGDLARHAELVSARFPDPLGLGGRGIGRRRRRRSELARGRQRRADHRRHDRPAGSPAAVLPSGAELDIDGITPIVVPNDRFYRIDTALIAPSVDVASWALTIKGMVDRPTT